MSTIAKNHQSKATCLSLIVVCMTCFMTLDSCSSKENTLIVGDAIEVVIPEEFKYDSDKDTYNLNDCSLSVSYDSIMQVDEGMPMYNFNNIMCVVELNKQVLHEEIIENDGLKLGVKEVLDKQSIITYRIFAEVEDHLFMINCQYKYSDQEIYNPKVQRIISSIRPHG